MLNIFHPELIGHPYLYIYVHTHLAVHRAPLPARESFTHTHTVCKWQGYDPEATCCSSTKLISLASRVAFSSPPPPNRTGFRWGCGPLPRSVATPAHVSFHGDGKARTDRRAGVDRNSPCVSCFVMKMPFCTPPPPPPFRGLWQECLRLYEPTVAHSSTHFFLFLSWGNGAGGGGGGGGVLSNLVFYAQSTIRVISARWGCGVGVGGGTFPLVTTHVTMWQTLCLTYTDTHTM